MITESENISDNATSVDSLALKFEDEPPANGLQLESGHATMDKHSSSPEHSERESRLSDSPQQQETKEEHVVAEESLADWGVVAYVFLNNLLATIDFTGFGVFYPYLVEHFESTTAAVGWCSSTSGFFQAVVALFASYPIKSYGCRFPAVVGCLLFSIGISFSCLAPNLTTIYFTYGVIAGSGSGLVIFSTNVIVHQRFNRNRNLASGIGLLGSGIGIIMGPILANHYIQSYGWKGAFLNLGAIQTHLIPLCLFFLTPKSLTSQSTHASGTSSRGISGQVILRYLKETFNFSIFRQARYSLYSIAYFLHAFCLMGYAQSTIAYSLHVVCYFDYWSHSVNKAFQVGICRDLGVIAVSLIIVIVTRMPVSFIANLPKVNSSVVFAIGMFSAFLSIVAIFINSGIIATLTSAVLFEVHLGCSTTVFPVVAVYLMGVALLPKSLAILHFTGGLAKLVSPPLIGWVFDVTLDYKKAFAIIGCMAFVSGSLMVVLTYVTRCHRKSVTNDIELSPSDKHTQINRHLKET